MAVATRDPGKIWELAKWARKDPEEKQRLLEIVDIKDTDGTAHNEAPKIARVMAEHFFPKSVVAKTSEIAAKIYPKEMDNISDAITSSR